METKASTEQQHQQQSTDETTPKTTITLMIPETTPGGDEPFTKNHPNETLIPGSDWITYAHALIMLLDQIEERMASRPWYKKDMECSLAERRAPESIASIMIMVRGYIVDQNGQINDRGMWLINKPIDKHYDAVEQLHAFNETNNEIVRLVWWRRLYDETIKKNRQEAKEIKDDKEEQEAKKIK